MKKQSKGITLVALVITIIILLILAGITINTLTGSGLFENTKLAKERTKNAQELENKTLGEYENEIGKYINGTRSNLPTEILYPNGSKDNPPTINVGQRIEIPNPYPTKNVYTRVEFNINGVWGEIPFTHIYGTGGAGVSATQIRSDDKDAIVIQAGSSRLTYGSSAEGGDGFGNTGVAYQTAPYRLIVICLD